MGTAIDTSALMLLLLQEPNVEEIGTVLVSAMELRIAAPNWNEPLPLCSKENESTRPDYSESHDLSRTANYSWNAHYDWFCLEAASEWNVNSRGP